MPLSDLSRLSVQTGTEMPDAYGLYNIQTAGHVTAPLWVIMCIIKFDVGMEVDTGSGFSIISETKYVDLLGPL